MCVYVCAAFQGGAGNLGQRLLGPSPGPGLTGLFELPCPLYSLTPLPASHEVISIHQFCKVVFLILILQIGKLPRELQTLASGTQPITG